MSAESHGKGGSWWLILVLMSPIVYFLSIGPAIWLHPHLPDIGQDALESFYRPLEYLAKIKPFERLFEAYVSLWG